jgi:hypothetical protein
VGFQGSWEAPLKKWNGSEIIALIGNTNMEQTIAKNENGCKKVFD